MSSRFRSIFRLTREPSGFTRSSAFASGLALTAAQREAVGCTALLGVLYTLIGAGCVRLGWLSVASLVLGLLVFICGSLLVARALPEHHRPVLPSATPHARYGAANCITQFRLMLVSLLFGHFVQAQLLSTAGWFLVGFVLLAAMLDALDGAMARAQRLSSALGARFDMEVDAFFILVLALLCWQLNKASAWIILAGALRYGFVAAAWRWLWLSAPLPPSRRRQSLCVVQIVALIVCLAPAVEPPLSALVAGLSLLLLAASFGIDIRWLALRRGSNGASNDYA